MFNNMGRKIQALAVTLCWMGIGIFVVAGLVLLYYGVTTQTIALLAGGVLVLILGPLFSWISIFILYAFGDLVSNVQEIKEQLYQMEYPSDDVEPEQEPIPESVFEPMPDREPIPESVFEPIPDKEPEPIQESIPEQEPVQSQDSTDPYTPDASEEKKYFEKYFS